MKAVKRSNNDSQKRLSASSSSFTSIARRRTQQQQQPSSSHRPKVPPKLSAQPTELELRGIKIRFPFKPYKCQEEYMGKVIDALASRENALLESPTGTGKTLCLLCATLAWQSEYARQKKSDKEDSAFVVDSTQQPTNINNPNQLKQPNKERTPTIIYASRTHSQISQVVRELRNTSYRPKHTLLGSRQQMCVNSKVKKATSTSTEINHDCNKLGMERKCRFKNNLENYTKGGYQKNGYQPVRDMEDLLEMGNADKICPFYYTRGQVENAELILLPYNYLFDKDSRTTTLADVPWDNSVVIFDEAHNLESFASESASFDLTSLDIGGCVGEVNRAMGYLDVMGEGGDGNRIKKDNLVRIKSLLLNFENYVLSLGNKTSYRGEFMMEIFTKGASITHATHQLFLQEIRKLSDIFMEMSGGSNRGCPRLDHFVSCVKQVFGEPTEARCIAKAQSYRVHVSPKNNGSGGGGGGSSGGYNRNKDSGSGGRTISYWCFAPAEAMRELANLNVRSILVTSGTLSPLDSYALELDLPFPHRIENPHIIPNDQIHVRVVGKGVSGKLLTSSYERRQDEEYYTELGNTLVSLGKIVPGGMLIFFPSYGVMETCLEKWGGPIMGNKRNFGGGSKSNSFFAARKRRSTGAARYSFPHAGPNTFRTTRGEPTTPWKRLLGTKAVVVEPRSSADLPDAIVEFHKYLSLQKSTGVALLGVCRGKISEGIDFAHDMCRAVVITGLPFAPSFDPKVKMKREFLDQARALQNTKPDDNGGFDSHSKPKAVSLSGHEWYTQQAHRSVNQAIGRTIRNKIDYGAVLLLDSRFSLPANQAGLSKWVRPHILPDEGVGRAIGGLVQFYKNAEEKTRRREKEAPPLPSPNKVSIILRYEDEGKENHVSSNEEEEISKIAVVAGEERGEAQSDSPDKTYVAPNRIVTRIDMNEKEGAKKAAALFPEMSDDKAGNQFNLEETEQKSKVDHTKTDASVIVSSTPKPRGHNVQHSAVSVELKTPALSAGNVKKKSSGSPSQTIARQFFKIAQDKLSHDELSIVKKSVTSMMKNKEARQKESFIKAAKEILKVILKHDTFEGKTKDQKPELLSLLFQLLPRHFLFSVQQHTVYAMLQRSEIFKLLRTEVSDPNDRKKMITDVAKFVIQLWFGNNFDENSSYLHELKTVLQPLLGCCKLPSLLSSILQVTPRERHQVTRAFFGQVKASQNIARLKGSEKKQFGEGVVDSNLFRRRQINRQELSSEISNEGGLEKSVGIESLKKEPEDVRYATAGRSAELKKRGNPYTKVPSTSSVTKIVDFKTPCKVSNEERPQKRVMSLSSLMSNKRKPGNDYSNPVKRALEESASGTYTGAPELNTANKIRSISQCDFTCTLCSNQSKTPLISECGHLGCGDCWMKWLEKRKECLVCRAPVSKDTLARAIFKK